jgi:hypothetical protein
VGTRRASTALGRFVVIAVAAIGGLALATSGVALAAALTHRGPAASAPPQALPATHVVADAAIAAASERLGGVLTTDFPASYGGLEVAENGQRITVYMTRMPKDLTRVVDAVAPQGAVAYHRSAHSLESLLAIHRAVAAAWLSLQEEGIDIVGFGPNVATSTEQIQVIGPTLPQVERLVGLFGDHTVSVKSVSEAPIPASYTLRVDSESHGVVPWDLLPVLAVLWAGLVGSVIAVVLVARRRAALPEG